MTTYGWFETARGLTLIYLALMLALAWRLGWLRIENRAPRDTPSLQSLRDQARLVAFLFNGGHRQIGDPIASTLVIVCRVLLVTSIVAIGFSLTLSR